VEVIRNVPLLVQLFFWYAVIAENLPGPREALQPLPGVFLSNRGSCFRRLVVVAVRARDAAPGRLQFRRRQRADAGVRGARRGLVIYTAAFIAEIVRAGVLAVSRGQVDAAYAVGLTRRAALRYVILPQALRLVVPPMTSQYLNLTKNSSLAWRSVPGPRLDRQHDDEPDRAGDRGASRSSWRCI
jgi:general L-amino acid transport system permease protein